MRHDLELFHVEVPPLDLREHGLHLLCGRVRLPCHQIQPVTPQQRRRRSHVRVLLSVNVDNVVGELEWGVESKCDVWLHRPRGAELTLHPSTLEHLLERTAQAALVERVAHLDALLGLVVGILLASVVGALLDE